MELLKLLEQGDLFHVFLFNNSLPQFFHQAQEKARQSLAGVLRLSQKKVSVYLDPRPNLSSLKPLELAPCHSLLIQKLGDPPQTHVSLS